MTLRFIDSSFIIALHARRDQSHRRALDYWRTAASGTQMVTTTYVLDEVVTFLNSRECHVRAVDVGQQIRGTQSIELLHVDESLFERGWDYFVRHADKRYSLTDCISFVVMEQRGLRQALSFDRHFVQAGFECVPEASA